MSARRTFGHFAKTRQAAARSAARLTAREARRLKRARREKRPS